MQIEEMTSFIVTCEASRFEFESDDSIQKWRADSKFLNQPHMSLYHKPLLLFNKKLQLLRRCKWDLFYVYDFMFM